MTTATTATTITATTATDGVLSWRTTKSPALLLFINPLYRSNTPNRVKITLQNEWQWDVETLLLEGENTNEFTWQVHDPCYTRGTAVAFLWRKHFCLRGAGSLTEEELPDINHSIVGTPYCSQVFYMLCHLCTHVGHRVVVLSAFEKKVHFGG